MAQGIDLFAELKKEFDLKEVDIRTYSPLSLAFIGDSVYDLVIRSYVTGNGNTSNNSLHNKTIKYVSAKAQARIADSLKDSFSEEEMTIYKRGKNAKPSSGAKNAGLSEYMKATGFEALIGYLYMRGKTDRMLEIIKDAVGVINE